MLENTKFIVFPVIRLKFGVRVNLRGYLQKQTRIEG